MIKDTLLSALSACAFSATGPKALFFVLFFAVVLAVVTQISFWLVRYHRRNRALKKQLAEISRALERRQAELAAHFDFFSK